MLALVLVMHIIAIAFCSSTLSQYHRLEQFQKCMRSKGIDPKSIVQRDWSNSSTYAALNHQWNIRLKTKYPLAYFIPKSTRSVQAGVTCGQIAHIHLTPKSGGHSYESYCFGDHEKIIIDFREMDQVVIHKKEETATIGPGVLIGTLAAKLSEVGFGLPVGDCYSVGIGGHALGGGVGNFLGKFGLLLDHIVEITMVDAFGITHAVNALQNPDLFWGLRGIGSGMLGLVTQFKFKLFPTDNMRVQLLQLHFKLEDIGPVFLAWQEWLVWTKQNQPSVFSGIIIQGSAKGFPFAADILFQTTYVQDDKERKPEFLLKKILSIFPKSQNVTELYLTYSEMILYTGETTTQYIPPTTNFDYLNDLRKFPEAPQFAKAKSYFVDNTYSSNMLEGMLNLIRNIPKGKVFILIQSNSGAVSDINPTATAYVHRGSLYQVLVVAIGKEKTNKEGISWLNAYWHNIKFMENGESAQNYVDSDLIKRKEFLKRFYGVNKDKLLLIKRRWDPQNYFRNPESLPVF